jgi:3',5'-cyclic AMP phosphodiesterase CpdA
MRTIAHISDIHFGRVHPAIAELLLADLHVQKPDMVVVSGDLTQRARAWQYAAAAEFLKKLPQPYLVVPGNHDIPLYDVLRRFFSPLGRYTTYITRDLRPVYRDDYMAVLGINTARSFTWTGGHITEEQLLDLEIKLRELPPHLFKIIVTHHPFIPAPGEPDRDIVAGADRALAVFEACQVDLVLSGHLHLTYTGDIRSRYTSVKRSIIACHAGTATSTRYRNDEPNGYNLITLNEDRVSIQVRAYANQGFHPKTLTHFRRVDGQWGREEGEERGT